MSCFYCDCVTDQQPGILSGIDVELPIRMASETITTYFVDELRQKRIKPLKKAVTFYENSITFQELHIYSTVLAQTIRDALGEEFINENPDEEIIIAMCLPPSERMIVTIFSILKLGVAICPLSFTSQETILSQILENFYPVLLITEATGPIKPENAKFHNIPYCKIVYLADLWKKSGLELEDDKGKIVINHKYDAIHETAIPIAKNYKGFIERAAIVLQSSDNYNIKGVRISHGTVMNRISWTWSHLPYIKKANCVLNVPITHSESLNQIFGPLLKGVTLHVLKKEELEDMFYLIQRLDHLRISRINLTPNVLREFLQQCRNHGIKNARYYLRYLKLVNCKGDPLPWDVAQSFFEIFGSRKKKLCNLYGYRETSGDVICDKFRTLRQVKKTLHLGRVSIGNVIHNAKIYLLTSTEDIAQNGQEGQVCVAGLPLAMSYVNTQVKHDNPYIVNPFLIEGQVGEEKYAKLYKTGDYGKVIQCKDGRNRLILIGRNDSLLRHYWHEFYTDDIRHALKDTGYFTHVSVIVYGRGMADQTVVAFAFPLKKWAKTLTKAKVRSELVSRIPDYMIPEILILEASPSTPTGKRDRHALIKIFQDQREIKFNWQLFEYKSNLANDTFEAGKQLLTALYRYSSIPVENSSQRIEASYFDLGGSAGDIVNVVLYLNQAGYPISIPEFVGSINLKRCMHTMVNRRTTFSLRREELRTVYHPNKENNFGIAALDIKTHAYSIKQMRMQNQVEVCKLIAHHRSENGELEKYNMITVAQYLEFLLEMYKAVVRQELGLIIIRESDNRIVGVSINYDFFTDLYTPTTPRPVQSVLNLIQEVKGEVADYVEMKDGIREIFECFFFGYHKSVTPKELVRLQLMLWTENLKTAMAKGYKSIFIATSEKFTRDLLINVLDFKKLDEFVAYEFVESEKSGRRPFHLALNTISLTSLYKILVPIPEADRLKLSEKNEEIIVQAAI